MTRKTKNNPAGLDLSVTSSVDPTPEPIVSDTIADLIVATIGAGTAAREAVDSLVYTVATDPNVGRGRAGISVTLPGKSKPVILFTVSDLLNVDALRFSKATLHRTANYVVLSRDLVQGVKVAGFARGICSDSNVGALVKDGRVVEGATRTALRDAIKADADKAAAKAAKKAADKKAADTSPDDDDVLTTGDTRFDGMPNSVSQRLILVHAILAGLKTSDLTPATMTRLKEIDVLLDAKIATTPEQIAAAG